MNLREATTDLNGSAEVVVEALEGSAPVLRDIQFVRRTGSAPVIKEGREPSVEDVFRALNEEETSDPVTRNEVPVPKKIVSFEARVDRVLEDRNEDVTSEMEQELRLKSQTAGYAIQETFFEGDSATSPKVFTGLKKLVKPAHIITPAAALVLSLGGDSAKLGQQQWFETVLNFCAAVPGGATHLYLNGLVKNRALIVAKNLGFYRSSKDELGSEIEMIGDIIVRSAGFKYDGTALLPLTETVSGDTNCTSAFAVRHGEGTDLTAITSVGVNADYLGVTKTKFHTTTVDLDIVLALQHPSAVRQLRRIKLG